MWNLVSHIKGIAYTEDVWEQGSEKDFLDLRGMK
jgi:hypothetical protein